MEMELYFKFFNTRLFEKGIVCSSRKVWPYWLFRGREREFEQEKIQEKGKIYKIGKGTW